MRDKKYSSDGRLHLIALQYHLKLEHNTLKVKA